MIKKLSKYGNSKALVIDKPILELLDINENTQLKITIDGKSLVITPVRKVKKGIKKTSDNKRLQKIVEKNVKKYASALKKLAKN
jgi:antitoxin MazE